MSLSYSWLQHWTKFHSETEAALPEGGISLKTPPRFGISFAFSIGCESVSETNCPRPNQLSFRTLDHAPYPRIDPGSVSDGEFLLESALIRAMFDDFKYKEPNPNAKPAE
jgi:hypothetical protein